MAFQANWEKERRLAEQWSEEMLQPEPDLIPLLAERQALFDQSLDLLIAANAENPHPDYAVIARNCIAGLQTAREHCNDPHCPCVGKVKIYLKQNGQRTELFKATPEQTKRLRTAFPNL